MKKKLSIPCPLKLELWHLSFKTFKHTFETKKVNNGLKEGILINLLGEKAAKI